MKKIILFLVLILSTQATFAVNLESVDVGSLLTDGAVLDKDNIKTTSTITTEEKTPEKVVDNTTEVYVDKNYESKQKELKKAEDDLDVYEKITDLEKSKKEELPDYNKKLEEYDNKIIELQVDEYSAKDEDKELYQKQIDSLEKEKESLEKIGKTEYNKDIEEKNNKIKQDNAKIEQEIVDKKGKLKNSELKSLDDAKTAVKEKKEEVYTAKIEKAKVDVNSTDTAKAQNAASILYDDAKKNYNENMNKLNSELEKCGNNVSCIDSVEEKISKENESLEASRETLRDKERAHANSAEGKVDLTSFGFQINAGDLAPGQIGEKISGKEFEEKGNFVLGTIIQSLMKALGVLSVLIMTIGGGYIVLNNGQDELLNKGKTIFMSGVYAMIIALSSYVVISMIRFILYSNTN